MKKNNDQDAPVSSMYTTQKLAKGIWMFSKYSSDIDIASRSYIYMAITPFRVALDATYITNRVLHQKSAQT